MSMANVNLRGWIAAATLALICIALLLGAWLQLSPRIHSQREHARLMELADVLPPSLYDNAGRSHRDQ